jgi:PAS domain S-box-containing protein
MLTSNHRRKVVGAWWSSLPIYERASLITGITIAVVGVSVLADWWLRVEVVKGVLPDLAAMNCSTALCFVLSGAALCAIQNAGDGPLAQRGAGACALLVAAIAVFTLLEYRFGWNSEFDELAERDSGAWGPLGGSGRMSVATVFGFLAVAAAILLIDFERERGRQVAQFFALLVTLIGGIGVLDCIFGVYAGYGATIHPAMSLQTSMLFVVAGVGIMLARPNSGALSVLTNERLGGRLSRVVLPAVLVITVGLSWLSFAGHTIGLYEAGFGFALNGFVSVIVLSVVVWSGADRLNRLEEKGERTMRFHAFLAAIVESSDDAIVSKDLKGIVTAWNLGAERIYGYSAAEMLERPLTRLLPPDRSDEERQILAKINRGEGFVLETVRRRKDGRLIDVLLTVSPITDERGNVIGVANVGRDITERKRAEERFQLVVEAAPNAIIMANRDGRIILVNSHTEQIFGYRRDELIGQSVEMLVPERFRTGHPHNRAVFFGDPTSRPMGTGRDLYGLRRDGSELPVEIGLNPIETSEGTVVLAAVVDITERKRLEERFRATVESAPTAMVMVDRQGDITLVNTLTETLFGYRRDELLGQPVETLLPERYRIAHPGLRDGFFAAPNARRMGEGRELNGRRKDGSEFPLEIGLNPIETSEGAFVLSTIADITTRKRFEKDLRERTDELARSNEDLEQFAYVASHDLQEPLRAVGGALQLLQRRYQGQLDARADEFIGHAVDGAARMQTLIDDLLTYSRVGRLTDPVQLSECDLALDQALRNLTAAIQEANVRISRDTLPAVRGIPSQLALLFQNLVGNAIKFRRENSTLQIHVGSKFRDDAWLLWVKDNGIGIESQYFERIFLIFQRLHTRSVYPGTGVGLALCKRIVERHGGRIWVESEPGKGATFFFTLLGELRSEL